MGPLCLSIYSAWIWNAVSHCRQDSKIISLFITRRFSMHVDNSPGLDGTVRYQMYFETVLLDFRAMHVAVFHNDRAVSTMGTPTKVCSRFNSSYIDQSDKNNSLYINRNMQMVCSSSVIILWIEVIVDYWVICILVNRISWHHMHKRAHFNSMCLINKQNIWISLQWGI